MVCMAVSVLIEDKVSFAHSGWIIPIVTVGLVGNILETACHNEGMFKYNDTWVTRMIILKKPVKLWGVPIAVRIGYFIFFGVFCAWLLEHLGK